ncbi:MAG: hypothetical protein AB7W37_10165 [Syntrophobacteraceae bacterium]
MVFIASGGGIQELFSPRHPSGPLAGLQDAFQMEGCAHGDDAPYEGRRMNASCKICVSRDDLPSSLSAAETSNPEVMCTEYPVRLNATIDQGWRGFTCREAKPSTLEELAPVSSAYEAAHCQALKDTLIHGSLARTRRKALSFYEGFSVQANDIM